AGIAELVGLFLGLCAFHLTGGEGHGIDLRDATGDTMIVGWLGRYRPGLSGTNIDCKPSGIKAKKNRRDLVGLGGTDSGGSGEIRTHGWVAPSQVFKTGPFNRSGTLPHEERKCSAYCRLHTRWSATCKPLKSLHRAAPKSCA